MAAKKPQRQPKRWTEEEKKQILAEKAAGATVESLVAKHGITPASIYQWRKKDQPPKITGSDEGYFRNVAIDYVIRLLQGMKT